MNTTNEVYRKIKDMSGRLVHPRPLLMVNEIANELQVGSPQLSPMLSELKDLHLITVIGFPPVSVKLTLLGNSVKR
ncbi:hypothetical protein ACTHGU_06530 [Chitinophagaceae bacterium MMS25-I14]